MKINTSSKLWKYFGVLPLIFATGLFFWIKNGGQKYSTIEEIKNMNVLQDPFSKERGMVGVIDSLTLIFLRVKNCDDVFRYNKFVDSAIILFQNKKDFAIGKTGITPENDSIFEWIVRRDGKLFQITDSRRDPYSEGPKVQRIRLKSIGSNEYSIQQCKDTKLKGLSLLNINGKHLGW